MNYLVVGLGNIGEEYAGTRHNMGFMVLDAWSRASNFLFTTRRYGDLAEVSVKGRRFYLLKPSTYMNLSGNAVRYWLLQEKIPVENMLVVVDDLSLPLGTIRIRMGGSDGGHNGLKHIAQTLGGQGYNRLRFGIGNDFPQGYQVDFVLSKFSPEEEQIVNEKALVACDAIKAFALSGIQFAMCNFNNK